MKMEVLCHRVCLIGFTLGVLGLEEKSNWEVIILVCTGLVATLFWLLLTLFIRKLKKVSQPECHTAPSPHVEQRISFIALLIFCVPTWSTTGAL